MPIKCSSDLQRLTTEAFGELDYEVMAHAFACQKELGRLADESVYQADLAARLLEAGLPTEREAKVEVSFRGFSKIYYLDLVVRGSGVYELKSVAKLLATHSNQLMNYLMFVDRSRGKVVNFRPGSLESRFVNAPLTLEERQSFTVRERN